MRSSSVATPRVRPSNFVGVTLFAARPALYILILICSLLGGLAYKLRGEGIFACPAGGYGPDHYLAHCETTGYADFDHGAFWYGLEPRARQSAAAADVLFLGSSRMQFAFSTDATRSWFSQLGIPYYLLGFSYTENIIFADPLLKDLKPKAKAYVINVDRFFDDTRETAPARQILRDGDARARYQDKQFWQGVHKGVCTVVPSLCGNRPAFFRSYIDGSWELEGSTEVWNAIAKTTSDGPASDREQWSHFSHLSRKFLSDLPVDQNCVILTLAPSDGTKTAEATAIATALGVNLIAPELDELKTFDGSHLDRPSAERWSRAFFDAAGRTILECVRASP
jgi:hypothetical protein